MSDVPSVSRRGFIASSSTLLAGAWENPADVKAGVPAHRPLKLAAVSSIYRLRSHAYHIVGRFILGYQRDGFHHQPPFQVVRMFNHQHPRNDMEQEISQRHGVRICSSATEAMGGKDGLDVDGVLLIVEHGDYPLNARQQIQYPRFELFEEIVGVFRRSGRSVPVFVDKHLSYDCHKAAKMVATAKELGFPLMAGSSLPVSWRRPEIEPPLETPFRQGLVCFGYDAGPEEIYLFHALETMQCLWERRRGGETGVKSVTALKGGAVWKAGDEGRWSWKLLDAALARCPSNNVGPVRDNVKNPTAFLIEYLDGTTTAILNLAEQIADHAFAATIDGREEPISTCFFLPAPPGARFFDPLVANIERLFLEGKAPYPVERTLLTSTILDWGMRSLSENGRKMNDVSLRIAYEAPASTGFFRGPISNAGAM